MLRVTLVKTSLDIYARAGMSPGSIIEPQAASSKVNSTAPMRPSAGFNFPWASSKYYLPGDLPTGVEVPTAQATVGS